MTSIGNMEASTYMEDNRVSQDLHSHCDVCDYRNVMYRETSADYVLYFAMPST